MGRRSRGDETLWNFGQKEISQYIECESNAKGYEMLGNANVDRRNVRFG